MAIDLTKYGITGTTEIVYNPSYEELFAEETKHQFRFECIGIKNNLNEPMKNWRVQTIKSTPQKVQKMKILEVEDEEAFLKLTGFDGIRGGVVKSKQKHTACLIERY